MRVISWLAGTLLVFGLITFLQFHRMQVADRRDALEALGYLQYDSPRVIQNFLLMDKSGVPASDRLYGNWSVIFFGYTRCPDVCPTTLSVLRQAALGLPKAPNIVMVSVDARDDVALVERYVTAFDSRFFALTASRPDLLRVTEELGIEFFEQDSGDSGYTVEHSALLVVLNPQLQMTGYLRPPHHIANVRAILNSLGT